MDGFPWVGGVIKHFVIQRNSSFISCILPTLQVYCVATGRYACHNKYYGRSLDDSGFKSAIVEYLTGGGGDLRDSESDDHWIYDLDLRL